MSEQNAEIQYWVDSRIPYYMGIDLGYLRDCQEAGDFTTKEELAQYLDELVWETFCERQGVSNNVDEFIDANFPELPTS